MMLSAYLLLLVLDVLLLLVVAYVLLLLCCPARGVHRAGAPPRPAPVRGRHEGKVKPGWPELRQACPPARHESGPLPLLEAA